MIFVLKIISLTSLEFIFILYLQSGFFLMPIRILFPKNPFIYLIKPLWFYNGSGAAFLKIWFWHNSKSIRRNSDFSLSLENYYQTGPDVSCFKEIRLQLSPVYSIEVRIANLRTAALRRVRFNYIYIYKPFNLRLK